MVKTYTLKTPVVFGSQTYSQLEFQPLKAKHVRDVKLTDASLGQFLDIAVKITGVSKHVIDDLSIEDTTEVIQIVQGFLENGRKIGSPGTPS